MPYTEVELNKLIEDVEKEFTAHLAKAEAAQADLAKSEVVESVPAAPKTETVVEQPLAKAEEPAKEEKKPEEKPAEEKKPEEKPAEEKPTEEKKPEEKPAEEKKPEDEHGYDEKDVEEMHKMYHSMSKAELGLHCESVKKAMEHHGCAEQPMAKSEDTSGELLKSELLAEKSKSESLQKSLDMVTDILTKMVKKAPQAKAITSLDVIAKSEVEEKPLTKSEITPILAKKAADPSLSRADREAINAFYLDGANINSISHLLK